MEYEDIEVGDKIPSLSQKVTILQTVMYCAVTWDFARQHYDCEYAQDLGFQQPVVDPQMYGAFFARMLTDWTSLAGRLKNLKLQYRKAGFRGDTLTYKGEVVEKYIKDGHKYVDCDLLVENDKGEHLVEGTAVVSFPNTHVPTTMKTSP